MLEAGSVAAAGRAIEIVSLTAEERKLGARDKGRARDALRGDRWGKGKEEKRPGLFNCADLVSHQPTGRIYPPRYTL